MTNNVLIIVLVGLIAWMYKSRNAEGKIQFPSWLTKAIGLFLIIVLVRNLKDVLTFVFHEADAWWPLVKQNAHQLAEGLRHLIEQAGDDA